MSRLTLILLLSGLLNAGAAFAYLRTRTPAATTVTTAAAATPTPPPIDFAHLPLDSAAWSVLQAAPTPDELPSVDFVAHLRDAGFPIDLIRALVRQQVDTHFAPREAAIAAAHTTTNYWEPGYNTNAGYRESGPERIALRLEKAAVLRDLLGADAESPRELARRQRDYGDLPLAKVDQLITLRTAFDHAQIELQQQSFGIRLPADQAERQRLEDERTAAINALFTPDELATYELHSGDSSNDLRAKLRWFQPTEAEFLALYVSQAEFDRHYHQPPVNATAAERQAWDAARSAAAAALEADFAQTLTPERYAEYQLTASATYKTMRGITDRLNLPPAAIADLAAAMTRAHDAALADVGVIVRDPSLSAADRAARIAAATAQAAAALPADAPLAVRAAYERANQQRIQQLQRSAPRVTPPTTGN